MKWRYFGVESITISSILVGNNDNLTKLIQIVNISSTHLLKIYDVTVE